MNSIHHLMNSIHHLDTRFSTSNFGRLILVCVDADLVISSDNLFVIYKYIY